jgi:hypothetical protein
MGRKKVTYNPPVIPKDDTFANFLKYTQEREAAAEARAAQERAEAKAAEDARRAAGASSYSSLASGLESQLRQGLIGYTDATSQLRDYATKYNMAPPESDVTRFTDIYTKELLPGRRQTGISSAYEEILGRQATAEEQQKATERFNQGYYSSVEDLRNSLYKGQEYQDKFNQSYLDNYYDTMFGKQTTDESGKKTGQRTFKFASNLLPTMAEGTKQRSGVITPNFGESFTGTAAEIEEQQQNIRDTRQFLYSAGLTNLQGEIDKETQQLKNEGSQKLAKIQAQGGLYQQLVGSFSF